MSAVVMVEGCTSEENADTAEGSSEGDTEETTEETTQSPKIEERTVIKETTVVMVPTPGPSPEQASSHSSEVQQTQQQMLGPEPSTPEVEIPSEVEISPVTEIPHDGTVMPCFQDPVCSSEQARIQSEHVAELEAAKADGQLPPQNLLNMCRQAVQSKNKLPEVCRSLGG